MIQSYDSGLKQSQHLGEHDKTQSEREPACARNPANLPTPLRRPHILAGRAASLYLHPPILIEMQSTAPLLY